MRAPGRRAPVVVFALARAWVLGAVCVLGWANCKLGQPCDVGVIKYLWRYPGVPLRVLPLSWATFGAGLAGVL